MQLDLHWIMNRPIKLDWQSFEWCRYHVCYNSNFVRRVQGTNFNNYKATQKTWKKYKKNLIVLQTHPIAFVKNSKLYFNIMIVADEHISVKHFLGNNAYCETFIGFNSVQKNTTNLIPLEKLSIRVAPNNIWVCWI